MIQYRILKKFFPLSAVDGGGPAETTAPASSAAEYASPLQLTPMHRSKFESFFGKGAWEQINGKSVLDFGCGAGEETIIFALGGAKHVTGLDIRPAILDQARALAIRCDVDSLCTFTTELSGLFDIIISQDAFEHYENPEAVLETMRKHLAPHGEIWISFGPPWFHPNGGHLFSVFPWAHLIFSEKALLRWRSDFKSDGATTFSEVAGGLNKMTLSRFRQIVKQSSLKVNFYHAKPIRALARFAAFLPKEFITSVVIAKLAVYRVNS